ncbi:MAG: hypothetical protein IPH41_15180 [Sulfuritalea sp.]|nr:hypothetical protein [Sulfuritalea sp.]
MNSTNRKRLVQVLGLALIALALYAMLAAMVLATSLVLLQKGHYARCAVDFLDPEQPVHARHTQRLAKPGQLRRLR